MIFFCKDCVSRLNDNYFTAKLQIIKTIEANQTCFPTKTLATDNFTIQFSEVSLLLSTNFQVSNIS